MSTDEQRVVVFVEIGTNLKNAMNHAVDNASNQRLPVDKAINAFNLKGMVESVVKAQVEKQVAGKKVTIKRGNAS